MRRLDWFVLTMLLTATVIGNADVAYADCKSPIREISQPDLESVNPIFTNLKHIGLSIEIISDKRRQSEIYCRGKEDECADQHSWSTSEERDAYIDNLKLENSNYPEQFTPENILRLFRVPIETGISRFLEPDKNCHIPEMSVLRYGQEIKKFKDDPDNLIVFVRVELKEKITPALAVIRTDFYRGNPQHTNLNAQVYLGKATAIPLNLPREEVSNQLAQFVNHSF